MLEALRCQSLSLEPLGCSYEVYPPFQKTPQNIYILSKPFFYMEIDDKNIKKLVVIALILFLGVLVFFLIKPVLLSIIGGLILAYMFLPIYKKIQIIVKSKNLAASIISLIAVLIIAIPIWFFFPMLITRVFQLFKLSQALDLPSLLIRFFPSASPEFITQITVTANSFISNLSSGVLTALVNFFLNLPTLALQAVIVLFVFFFALRDSDKLKSLVSDLSPLAEKHEKLLVQKFKVITDSIIYGQIVVGIAQGIVAGLGLLIFGVPHALILTILAILFSVIPIAGPGFVWVPVAVYLFSTSNFFVVIAFLIYNLFLTSTIDNFLRPYIIAKRADLSQVVVLVGMIGGLFIFGILGIILGPLILAYFLTFLEAYRSKTLTTLFE